MVREKIVRDIFAAEGHRSLTATEFEIAYRRHPQIVAFPSRWAADPALAGAGRLRHWISVGLVISEGTLDEMRYRLAPAVRAV